MKKISSNFLFYLFLLGCLGICSSLPRPKSLKNNQCEQRKFGYTSFQTGMYCQSCYPVQHPKTIKEVQNIVKKALSENIGVKAFGSRHSIVDSICTDGIPVSMKKINYANVDVEERSVRVGAGSELTALLEACNKYNLTTGLTASFGGITVGGSLGIGAQTSSIKHPNALSDYVTELTIVDGLGNIKVIDKEEDLQVFRVNLGLLGIIVEVKLKLQPEFKMRMTNIPYPDKILLTNEAAELARTNDFLQMYWFPNMGQVVVAKGEFLPADTPGNAKSNFFPNFEPKMAQWVSNLYEVIAASNMHIFMKWVEKYVFYSFLNKIPIKETIMTDEGKFTNPGIGYAHRLITSICDGNDDGLNDNKPHCGWSHVPTNLNFYPEYYIYSFDIERLPEVIKTFKRVIRDYDLAFPLIGIEILFVRSSDQLLRINYGRQAATIVWSFPRRHDPINQPRMGITGFQIMAQLSKNRLGARSHWGASGITSHIVEAQGWEKTYPEDVIEKFRSYMVKYDPHGVFLNNFGKRFMGYGNVAEYGPLVKHCALQDHCLCERDEDCGPSLKCSKVEGLHLCHDKYKFPIIPPKYNNV